MATFTCATCAEAITAPDGPGARPWQAASDALWQHHQDEHVAHALPRVTQLPGVTFHEQALLAIRALAQTGREFTVGEAHPMVTVPAPNPRTDWETARKEAERLGWIEWAEKYAESIVPTTKGSAVKVWRGTAASRRAVA